MENQIRHLKISNFKSIREAELECGRINLFVGKPNTGKSNVLEAITLLGGFHYNEMDKFMSDFIRYDEVSNLFFYQNTDNHIQIESNIADAVLYHIFKGNRFMFAQKDNSLGKNKAEWNEWLSKIELNPGGQILENNVSISGKFAKKYVFKESVEIGERRENFLNPPFGNNLFSILQNNERLKEEIPVLFNEYNLEFVVDLPQRTFEIQRKIGNIAYKIPYHLIADTLQRIIFHYAAIFSNKDSVILFEEPESHSYPPYVRELAMKIIESRENQFFITTHSPYLFDTIVENTPPEELAVFVTDFEDYETKFKKLTDEEIADLMSYGTDIFFNLKWFAHHE